LGGPGRGGGGFRTGRKLAAADLQLLILALLAEKPAHGYELIKALEERSGGFYTPSPGMIYPALTYLDEIGYATVEADGTKKLYRATEAGLRHFAQNRTAAEAMLDELQRIGSKMDRVRQVFAGIEGADDIADDGDARGPEDLHAARRALKRALHHAVIDTPEDAKRIAAILRRAADEILGK
jgi:DNA-binding PadR family transcriptional regulator